MQLEKKHHISVNIFLVISLINVLILFLGIIDLSFTNLSINSRITNIYNPDFYFILIGFPHIFASFLTMFHRGYSQQYGKVLKYKVLPVFLVTLLLLIFSFGTYKLFFTILLSIHVAGQACGFAKFFNIKPSWTFKTWKYLNTILMFLGFLQMYSKDLLINFPFAFNWISNLSWVAAIVASAAAILLLVKPSSTKAKLFLVLIQIQFIGITFFSLLGNLFFWGIMLSLFHDFTAFSIYFNHEKNSHEKENYNFIKILKSPILNIFIISVLISCVLAKAFSWLAIPYAMFLFQNIHYMLEGDIWISGSIHRQNIFLTGNNEN
ncbi:MAG: hypothetical protein H7177_06885 [Rhizobacter sp.]|nr:hypothetical protein [Bacteriovorax sp.]